MKILVVTSDLPSHPYACAKLSKVLFTAGHDVTLAAPAGPAYDRIRSEVLAAARPRSGSPGTPGGTIETVEINDIMDDQEGSMYRRLVDMVGKYNYDVIIPIHSCANTVCDAVEAMAMELKRSAEKNDDGGGGGTAAAEAAVVPPPHPLPSVVIFSSLPYDPLLHLGGKGVRGRRRRRRSSASSEEAEAAAAAASAAWSMPRPLVALPHVSLYRSRPPPPLSLLTSGNVRAALRSLAQLFWLACDAYLINRAWKRSESRNDARRRRRGLPPVKDAYRGYLKKYPVITFGGVEPFAPPGGEVVVADNVTAVGCLDAPHDASKFGEMAGPLREWVDGAAAADGGGGIVYASFGTGTTLSEEEAMSLANLGLSFSCDPYRSPKVLLALRRSEQSRLRPAIEAAVGSGPTSVGDGYLEYLDGTLRVEADVPQAALLGSGHVRLFVSHFGFGGFCEGVRAGVPFVAYPAGLDQWYNASRAVEAGIALPASHGMEDIECVVWRALYDEELAHRAEVASKRWQSFGAEARVLDMMGEIEERRRLGNLGKGSFTESATSFGSLGCHRSCSEVFLGNPSRRDSAAAA